MFPIAEKKHSEWSRGVVSEMYAPLLPSVCVFLVKVSGPPSTPGPAGLGS